MGSKTPGYFKRLRLTTFHFHPIPSGHRLKPVDHFFYRESTPKEAYVFAFQEGFQQWLKHLQHVAPGLWGRTYEDIRMQLLSEKIEEEKRRREQAEMERLQRGYLTKEEKAAIAENLVQEAAAGAGKMLDRISEINEKQVQAFANEYLNIVKECLDEFLKAFEEAKKQEVRAFLVEEKEEYQRFLERLRSQGVEVEYGYGIDFEKDGRTPDSISQLNMEEADVRKKVERLRDAMSSSLTSASEKLSEASSYAENMSKGDRDVPPGLSLAKGLFSSAKNAIDSAKISLDSLDSNQFSKQVSEHSKKFSKHAKEVQESSFQDLVGKLRHGISSMSQSASVSRIQELSNKWKETARQHSSDWYKLFRDSYVAGDYSKLTHRAKSSLNSARESTKSQLTNKAKDLKGRLGSQFNSMKEKTGLFGRSWTEEEERATYDPVDWIRRAGKSASRASRDALRQRYLENKDNDGGATKKSDKSDTADTKEKR